MTTSIFSQGGGGDDDDAGKKTTKKPRKPRPETLEYVEAFLNDSSIRDRRQTATNVIKDLEFEMASVASDKRGGELLERLLRECPPRVVEAALRWCGPYAGFLARHRHASHVLESALALATTSTVEDDVDFDDAPDAEGRGVRCAARLLRDWGLLPRSDDDDHDDAPEEDEGEAMFSALSDWNASHVLRATIWALAGLPVVCAPRGRRNERHGHSVDDAARLTDRQLVARAPHNGNIQRLVQPLLSSAMRLQQACVDNSGAPTVALVLRVLAVLDAAKTSRGEEEEEEELVLTKSAAADAVARFLIWEGGDNASRAASVVYGLSFDARGSVVVQAVLRTCADATHARVVDLVETEAAAYVAGDCANYVLQSLVRTCRSEETFAKLARAVSPDRVALKPDRAGVASAVAETALRFSGDSTLVAPLVPLADLTAYVVDEERGVVREHPARAVAARLALTSSSAVAPSLFLRVLRDPAPWSLKLVDTILATNTACVAKAFEEDADHLDLVAAGETRRAVGNPVARIFAPESRLDQRLKRRVLKQLAAHPDLLRRAPNFARLLGLKTRKHEAPLATKIQRITGASAGKLVDELLLPAAEKTRDKKKKHPPPSAAAAEKKKKRHKKDVSELARK